MLATLVKTTRPPFLLLPLVVIALAGALAWHHTDNWSHLLFGLVLLGALAAHASVNVLNEVHDARSGLDKLTKRTPFSGGSGALQKNPAAIPLAQILGMGLLGLVILIGFYLIYQTGWGLLPIGLVGVGVVLAYTPKITRSPWLCLIAPGLGFGPLMVLGSYFVLTGEYSWLAFGISLIPFFLVNNLLLLNQFPDLEADRKVGRNNILIATGPKQGLFIFRWFLLGAFLTLLVLVALGYLPVFALLGLGSLVFALPLYWGLVRFRGEGELDNRLLAQNVLVNLTMPFFIAVGLMLEIWI